MVASAPRSISTEPSPSTQITRTLGPARPREVRDGETVEGRAQRLAQRDLDGVELAELAALANQEQHRDLVRYGQRAKDVGGVAQAAVLHQQGAVPTAQVGAADDADAL